MIDKKHHQRQLSLKIWLLPIVIIFSGCNSSNSDFPTPAPAVGGPVSIPEPISSIDDYPEAVLEREAIVLSEPLDPTVTRVFLPNSNAESATGAGQISTSNPFPGLSVTGNCYYRDTQLSAANGQWRYELAPGCSVTYVGESASSAAYTAEHAIAVDVDVHNSSSATANVLVEIISVQQDNSSVALRAKNVFLNANNARWHSAQVVSSFGEHAAYAGLPLGVRITNLSTDATVSVDNISLNLFAPSNNNDIVFVNDWDAHCDQLWAGRHFWSNRLQDWHLSGQRLETRAPNKYRPQRTTHRITSVMSSAPAPFTLAVDTGPVEQSSANAYSGFLIGAGGKMDYRSAALVHNRHGHNGGLIAGINHNGQVFFRDNDVDNRYLAVGETSTVSAAGIRLQLDGYYDDNGSYTLNLFAIDTESVVVSSTTTQIDPAKLLGNIALVSTAGESDTSHWFDNWIGAGPKLRELPNRQLGPVLFSSYTVNTDTLTLNAQYPPLCTDNIEAPTLEVLQQGSWNVVASSVIDPVSYTARFVVNNWDASESHQYRVVTQRSQTQTPPSYFSGIVKRDPTDESEVIIGLYNCRPGIIDSAEEGWIQQNFTKPFTWTRDRIVFPHEELITNSMQHNPHVVAFVGDQIYEFDPNGLVERELPDLMSDYLWKWYQFGWSARELMRNTPSFILPDDHDVFQGNLWGQNGVQAENEEDGGYVYPAEFINMVQRTQTGSLPDPVDGTDVEQGIGVYFTQLNVGGVGLAILEDRKFKSGPFSPIEDQQLLGARQSQFLENWASDWTAQTMKIAVSQSPFSQSTTHSGKHFNKLERDWDSNGWPTSGRNAAVTQLRKAYAPHISGDQHLGMSLQHGIDEPNDAVYSFAGPAMMNIFPRIWDPNNPGSGSGDATLSTLGEHQDVHGNLITVKAVANPLVYFEETPAGTLPSKNDLGIGYGIIKVDKPARRYVFEAWPANTVPSTPNATPYPNWPITFDQTDNDGRIPAGYLTTRVAAVSEPIVRVYDESDNSLVYARRYPTSTIELPVYDSQRSYRVELLDDDGYFEQFDAQTVTQ